MESDIKQIAEFLNLNKEKNFPIFKKILEGIYKCFWEKNAILIEINPLVLTQEGDLKVCDTKVKIDDNAFYL